jgi:hypothetical protein
MVACAWPARPPAGGKVALFAGSYHGQSDIVLGTPKVTAGLHRWRPASCGGVADLLIWNTAPIPHWRPSAPTAASWQRYWSSGAKRRPDFGPPTS